MLVSMTKTRAQLTAGTLNRLGGSLSDLHSDRVKAGPTRRLLKRVASLPKSRRDKVLSICRQLDAGTYEVNKRLDAATDRLIEKLVAEVREEDETKTTRQSLHK
jgi:hypothetical protein